MQTPDGPRTALGLLVVLALCLGVLAAVAPGTAYDVGYLSVLAGATAVAWWGGRRRTGIARTLALCVTGALAATTVADLVWYAYYWTSGEPDISWADPAYLLSYVLLGAALLARNAVEKGLSAKPWVKTSMAPGSQVVSDYYDKAGLWPYLEKLGFYLVGYGCTTCIGNTGPLPEEISKAVNDEDLTVTAVLSGNRNFEGRISPDVKMNYLASPPLVIAYALAGTMDFDFEADPLGQDSDGNDVFLKDIWPSPKDISDTIASAINQEMFTKNYADVFKGDERWRNLPTPEGKTFEWDSDSTYVRKPPYFEGMPAEPEPVSDIKGARVLALLGDSVTTDHISPAGSHFYQHATPICTFWCKGGHFYDRFFSTDITNQCGKQNNLE